MKNVRPPRFLDGLYRDMRDRRLLLPAIALVVGLLAVPILLKSHHSSSGTPKVATSSNAAASDAVEPAVVTRQMGVTQYRERLAELNSKNPFHQQYTTPPKSAQLHSTSTGVGTSSSTDTSADTTGSSTSAGSAAGTADTSATGSGAPPASSPSSGGLSPTPPSPDGAQPPPKPPKPVLLAIRAAIAIGEPGDLKRRDNVRQGVLLPSENKPMASFIGAAEDLSYGTFVLADTVDSVKGGHCLPSPRSCSLLQLKPGQEAHLSYAPQNRRYNLKLIGIRLVPMHHRKGRGSSGSRKKSGGSAVAGVSSQLVNGVVK